MRKQERKNKHPTILKILDEIWDEIKNIFPRENSQNCWPANDPIPKSN
ncbi:MAG TPA: hypothetical protein VN704_06625 [Verrucomicrobiae bacterium]|nr:hypothetical protein [Verrucomicrobiae bacterium]